MTFLLSDPGWYVHKPDVQNKWEDNTLTPRIKLPFLLTVTLSVFLVSLIIYMYLLTLNYPALAREVNRGLVPASAAFSNSGGRRKQYKVKIKYSPGKNQMFTSTCFI